MSVVLLFFSSKVEFSGRFTSEPGKFDFGGSGNVYQNYETGRYSLKKNAKTGISVSKVDISTGEGVEGAVIQIVEVDKEGNEKAAKSWRSVRGANKIEGLKTGVEYTLHETAAPNGYETAADITFMIDKYGIVTTTGKMSEDGTILIKNAKKTVKKNDKKRKESSKTGDDANAMLWLMLAIGASGSMICVTRKRKRA